MSKRKICVVTGSRAEYGLLYWLMREIQSDSELELQVVATGAHLSHEFGLTSTTIEDDGFEINAKVEMLVSSDTAVGIAKSIGLGVIGFADAFERLRPDILVLFGDRTEMFAAAQTALVARIPVAHLSGGELTEGAIDEAIRHSITKMSHMHFVSAEPYRQRVIQLGEDASKVMNFGSTGLDNIRKLPLLGLEELERAIGFALDKPSFLVTFHPATLGFRSSADAMSAVLAALDRFPDARIIFTQANSDADGRALHAMVEEFSARHPQRVKSVVSLGQLKYLSAIKHCDVVIGNSSSGLIEAPALQRPTVNIGPRQDGRLRAPSVIDCDESVESIVQAIQTALSPGFRSVLERTTSPYGDGNASERIKTYLKNVQLEGILMKRFHDLPAGPS
jgi:UDP-hydrolysing UDP-N-acetyl-D-glucosamine 2-epimerase